MDDMRKKWRHLAVEQAAEIERLRMQLAACGVAAHGGTSPEQVIERDSPYWTDAYGATLNMAHEIARLRKELREAVDVVVSVMDGGSCKWETITDGIECSCDNCKRARAFIERNKEKP